MTSKQYCIENGKRREETHDFIEAHHRMPDGKLIATVQICLRCGREVPFKKNRRRCSYCQGLVKNRTIILKFP